MKLWYWQRGSAVTVIKMGRMNFYGNRFLKFEILVHQVSFLNSWIFSIFSRTFLTYNITTGLLSIETCKFNYQFIPWVHVTELRACLNMLKRYHDNLTCSFGCQKIVFNIFTLFRPPSFLQWNNDFQSAVLVLLWFWKQYLKLNYHLY